MLSPFVDMSKKEVDKILEDVSTVYEKITGQRYSATKETEATTPIPPGVDPMEFLNQEYRYLMSLVASGAIRSPFSVPYLWSPPAEVLETPKEIVVRMDLPGVDRDDISLSLQNRQVLVVRGERRFKKLDEGQECNCLIMERTYGEFIKQIPLPDRVDVTAADAKITHGVLVLRLPRVRNAGTIEEQQIRMR